MKISSNNRLEGGTHPWSHKSKHFYRGTIALFFFCDYSPGLPGLAPLVCLLGAVTAGGVIVSRGGLR